MDLSKDIQSQFITHLRDGAASGSLEVPSIELGVQVLTAGSWPDYASIDCALPKEVLRLQELFSQFYLNKHSGRKLLWQNALATCVLKATLQRGRKEFAVSGYQASVLLLFNEAETLSLEQLGAMSRLPERELRQTLASLSLGDQPASRVLLKDPRNKKIADGDVFRVDANYRSPLFRVKINAVQLRDTKEDEKKVLGKVFEDRQYAVDALIVRIMKSRKTLTHNQLMADVFTQIAFPVKPADIKKRIATLIEREYMERDKDNAAVYNYVA